MVGCGSDGNINGIDSCDLRIVLSHMPPGIVRCSKENLGSKLKKANGFLKPNFGVGPNGQNR